MHSSQSPCLHHLKHHINKHIHLSREFLQNSNNEGRISKVIKIIYSGIRVEENPLELNKNTKETQL